MTLSWGKLRASSHSAQGHALSDAWARVMRCPKAGLDAAADSLRSGYIEGGGHVVLVDGAICQTTEDLFVTFAGALSFPDYFGGNWDAYDECFSDLLILDDGGLGVEFGDRPGVPARHLVIIIADADLLLGMDRNRSAERRRFIGTLQWAASGRGGDDLRRGLTLASLTVILHSVPEAADALTDWLSDANLSHFPLLELGGQCDD